MNETETAKETVKQIISGGPALDWFKVLILIMIMQILGVMARALMSKEELDIKRLCGEIIFAILFVTTLFAFGMMQDMGLWQIVVFGGLAGMGGVNTMEWIVCIIRTGLKK